MNDEEFGEQVAMMPAVESHERVSEWSPERLALADVADELRALHVSVLGALSENPPKFVPSPRPVTAVERARRTVGRRRHMELVSRLGLNGDG